MSVKQIADGTVVQLAYTLTVDGEEVDSATKDDTFEYLHGAENIVPGLERVLTGKQVGDAVDVTIPPQDAFGDYDPEDVEEVSLEALDAGEALESGMMIEVEDEDGDFYLAYVREITGDKVVLDFNPPLAGKTLSYQAKVLAIRAATETEINHGHVHEHDHEH